MLITIDTEKRPSRQFAAGIEIVANTAVEVRTGDKSIDDAEDALFTAARAVTTAWRQYETNGEIPVSGAPENVKEQFMTTAKAFTGLTGNDLATAMYVILNYSKPDMMPPLQVGDKPDDNLMRRALEQMFRLKKDGKGYSEMLPI